LYLFCGVYGEGDSPEAVVVGTLWAAIVDLPLLSCASVACHKGFRFFVFSV